VAGEATINALANQFGKSHKCVKDNLRKYGEARAAELSQVHPGAEYVDGLRYDLKLAERQAREAENPNAKVGALKLAVAIREKLAAALGVTTERIGLEHSTDPNNPLTFQIIQFGADDNGGGNREASPAGD
jgi:hypothetical protein